MNAIIFSCLLAVALARPQDPEFIGIVKDERSDAGDGNFAYEFETENGIYKNVNGRLNENGAQVIEGSFRFPLEDGTVAEVTFIANDQGYQPQSDLIPTPHPMPAHVLETLALIDELVAQGATWDAQGRRLTRRK